MRVRTLKGCFGKLEDLEDFFGNSFSGENFFFVFLRFYFLSWEVVSQKNLPIFQSL
jgi:hypothetical protein